jgi:hypothetical protein
MPRYAGTFLAGGERGIRTPGPVTVNGFQDRRIRPLCHLSGCKIIVSNFIHQKNKNQYRKCCLLRGKWQTQEKNEGDSTNRDSYFLVFARALDTHSIMTYSFLFRSFHPLYPIRQPGDQQCGQASVEWHVYRVAIIRR